MSSSPSDSHDQVASVEDVQPEPFKQTMSFPLYLIYSKKPLNYLSGIIAKHGDSNPFLRVVLNKTVDTNRTIALISDKAYDNLCKADYNKKHKHSDFFIQPFILTDRDFPREGRNGNLFIPVPREFSTDYDYVTQTIEDKIQLLVDWGILEPNSWSLKVPIKSRHDGALRGGCFLTFDRTVHPERVAVARLVLHDTYWPDEDSYDDKKVQDYFRCVWAHNRKVVEKKPTERIVKLSYEDRKTKHIFDTLKKLAPSSQPKLTE